MAFGRRKSLQIGVHAGVVDDRVHPAEPVGLLGESSCLSLLRLPDRSEVRACTTRMIRWTPGDLQRIAETDDLHISRFRVDGATYGTPAWIWSVVGGPPAARRAYNGLASRCPVGHGPARRPDHRSQDSGR
jgi:hypothetical protein